MTRMSVEFLAVVPENAAELSSEPEPHTHSHTRHRNKKEIYKPVFPGPPQSNSSPRLFSPSVINPLDYAYFIEGFAPAPPSSLFADFTVSHISSGFSSVGVEGLRQLW